MKRGRQAKQGKRHQATARSCYGRLIVVKKLPAVNYAKKHPPFDSDGWLLEGGDKRRARLAMELLVSAIAGIDREVVDGRHKVARKRYAREYRWEPSPRIEAATRKAIFGQLETDKS